MHAAVQLQVICFRAGVPPCHWQLPQRERREGKGQGIPPLLLNESTTLPLLPDLWLSFSNRLIRLLIDIHCRSSFNVLSHLSYSGQSGSRRSLTQSFRQLCDCITAWLCGRSETLAKMWPQVAESHKWTIINCSQSLIVDLVIVIVTVTNYKVESHFINMYKNQCVKKRRLFLGQDLSLPEVSAGYLATSRWQQDFRKSVRPAKKKWPSTLSP